MSDCQTLVTRIHKLLDDGYVLFADTVSNQYVLRITTPPASGQVRVFTGAGNDLGEALDTALAREQKASVTT